MSSWKINMMRFHYQRICLLSVTICLTFICINGQCMSSNDCRNGGTCNRPNCTCTQGYTGPTCEFLTDHSSCSPDLCQAGECIEDGNNVYCECTPFTTGPFCERTLSCSDRNLCQHGGTCMDGSTTSVPSSCVCSADWTGEICEFPLACNMNTCRNGGTCMDPPAPDEQATCSCTDSWEGPTCEDKVLTCTDLGCDNGGMCSGGTCMCPMDFTGEFCEFMASVCTCSPCENGGTCVDLYPSTLSPGCTPSPDVPTPGPDDYYMCECPSGFGGKNCEMNDPCRPNPCMNGGVCSVDNGMAMCDCTSTGFRGPVCGDNVNNPEPTPAGLTQETIGIIAGSAAAAVVIIIIVITIACCCCRRERNSDKDKLTGLEMGANNQPRRRYHDYVPSPTKTMMPAIPNLRVSKMRDETKMEFPRNRLTLLNKLGSGSFADVYKAEAYGITDKDAMTIVAVKKLKETATENDRSDLSKEISLFFFLDPHPNIVNILGCCTEADPWYIIMEYLPNGNLQGYLRQIRTGGSMAPEYKNVKKQTDIPPNDLLNFGVQIARGMEYLASRACIHRDLAARNILLGEGWVCKVSDFGLARDLEDGQTYEMKSQGRVPVRWMSPESLLHNTYTSQSDVWSFAVLIWEIVTLGSHPYPGMSSKQVVKEISAGYRLPRPEHCSQDIYDLMKECWQHDPEDRPTFSDITKKLENMLADAQGYLVMSDFNDDNYVYLEPDQHTGDTLDNEGFSHL